MNTARSITNYDMLVDCDSEGICEDDFDTQLYLAEIASQMNQTEVDILKLYYAGFKGTEIAEKLGEPIHKIYNTITKIRRAFSNED